MTEFFFDPEQQEGSCFGVIPEGDYVAQIVEAEIRSPKSGDGYMLCLTWKICDGEYENWQIWQQLCYQHSKQQTQDIARRPLKDICVALGINEQVTGPDVFKFKPARVRVSIESDKYGQFDDQNRIKRVRPLTEADAESVEVKSSSVKAASASPAASQPTTAPKSAPKPASGALGAAPWKKPAA